MATIAPLQRPVDRFNRTVASYAAEIRADERAAARKQEREEEEQFTDLGVSMATLESIAACESGGDPTAVSRDGRYRGKYQFTRSTWRGLGGRGDPAEAPEREQDKRALKLYRREGVKPWGACGRKVT